MKEPNSVVLILVVIAAGIVVGQAVVGAVTGSLDLVSGVLAVAACLVIVAAGVIWFTSRHGRRPE